MIGVVIIPTGIGAEIGGHAGDGNPVAKLFGAVCDIVIIHPNVVNAADINEMPANALYVEGSALDRFLRGEISLKPRRKPNKILVVAPRPLDPLTINAVSAARVTLGADIELLQLNKPLHMAGWVENNQATGTILGHEELVEQVRGIKFDVLAITSPINVDYVVAVKYLREGGANPWGKVEAMLSEYVSLQLNKPVAHAPMSIGSLKGFNEVVDPRMAPEMISSCYLHSVLKGLHLAPELMGAWRRDPASMGTIRQDEVDFMVTPADCWGPPHLACKTNKVPIISVVENRTTAGVAQDPDIVVNNYLEAAGVVASWRAGILPESVRRPIKGTRILWEGSK